MRLIIDSIEGTVAQCLLENGDILRVHKDYLPQTVQPGFILKVSFKIDQTATKKQKEALKSS